MTERQAFENNEVLLWGEKQAKKSLLDEFDTGNKNPYSKARKKEVKDDKEPKEKKPIKKREFEIGEDYGVKDIDFLNSEYDRIDDLLSKTKYVDPEYSELEDKQDKLYELLEGLEHLKKLSGKSVNYKKEVSSTLDDDFIGKSIKKISSLVGKGFKKGSPEAKAHAEKMRKALEAKKTPVEKVVKKSISSKARIVKGSEEAKELGRKLAEARKAKKPPKEETNEVPKKKTGKPWFYIGDIPKGYREATEDEAIEAKKVSYYGKYTVDETKWKLYKEYNMLLTENKTNREIEWTLGGLKRRIIESLKEIEILSSRLENDKYKDKVSINSVKLADEKEKRKYLQAGYNWYWKLLCLRTGKKYERQKIELPIKVFKQTEAKEVEYIEPKRPIDPRTGKEAEKYIVKDEPKIEEKKLGVVDVNLHFENGKDIIELSTKYFTPDYKLKPAYAKKLTDKGITLQKKYYTTEDYKKYFYRMAGDGIYKQIGLKI